MHWLNLVISSLLQLTVVWAVVPDGSCDAKDIHCNLAIDETLNGLDQEDPALIEAIRSRHLLPPSTQGHNFEGKNPLVLDGENIYPYLNGQYGQPVAVDRIFNQSLRNGFFIEAGAHDGYLLSNSLYFELRYNWTGLLVEPNPDVHAELAKTGRKAWTLPYCFSTKTNPEVITFDVSGLIGGIANVDDESKRLPGDYGSHIYSERRFVPIQCFPLYSVLMALGNPRVDYLSLDIEGAELQVLQTIPFDKVDIQVLGIEMNHVGEVFDGTRTDIRDLLFRNGYKVFQKVNIDEIFVKREMFDSLVGSAPKT